MAAPRSRSRLTTTASAGEPSATSARTLAGRFTLLAALVASTAMLAACATVGPDFERPVSPSGASGYAMAGDRAPLEAAAGEAAAKDWWALFRSEELDRTMRQAVAGNRSLAAARATLDQARHAIAAQDPKLVVDANAAVNHERINFAAFGFSSFPGQVGALENPTVTLYSFGANARYDFDLFGQRRRETEALVAQAEAERFQADAAYMTLTAQVAGQAINIAALEGQIAALEDVAASDRQNLEMVREAYRLGGGTKLDVTTIESELAKDEGEISPLRNQLSAARHALALLVGQAPADWTAPRFTLASFRQPDRVPVALPSELIRARPDILAAEARLHAATAQIGVAEGDLYPKVSLTAAITQTALKPLKLFSYDSTGWSLAPGVSLPLFNRGQLKARQAMAQDAARGALANYQQVVLEAFVQVADSLEAIALDDEAIALQTRAVDASSESLKLVRLRYQGGRTGLLPVLDAQRSYSRSRRDLVRAQAQRLRDTAQLLYATGAPWTPAA
jgi:NodT family efflux transporter outer membrane factor (OMF) lipoprotein